MRRLTKSEDRLLLGVAGGIAEYLQIDKLIVRVLWAVLTLPLPILILAYLILGVVLPDPGREPDYIDVTPGSEQQARRKLTKGHPRMLAGVCAGLADYFHADPTVVRLTFVVATFFSLGLGLLAYIVLAVLLPEPE